MSNAYVAGENIVRAKKINSWRGFSRHIRSHGCNLLYRVNDFRGSILVTGCQRSGTTILSRIITRSDGMVDYWFGRDDELDAALILSGHVWHSPVGRYCFQTTYLNECYEEYFKCDSTQKIIWMIRSPYSVVYSMLYHWKRFALNELFIGCGLDYLSDAEMMRFRRFGPLSVSRLTKACTSYVGKMAQLYELADRFSDNNIMVIDYDGLVFDKEKVLKKIYKYIGLDYRSEYGAPLHGNSLDKARKLSVKEKSLINEMCVPAYQKAKALAAD